MRQQNFDGQFFCILCAQIHVVSVSSVVSLLLSFLGLEREELTKRNDDTQLSAHDQHNLLGCWVGGWSGIIPYYSILQGVVPQARSMILAHAGARLHLTFEKVASLVVGCW